MFVIGLVEEDVFAIVDEFIGGGGAEEAVGLDAVFEAELFPEFAADLIAALAYLESYYFAWHCREWCGGELDIFVAGCCCC